MLAIYLSLLETDRDREVFQNIYDLHYDKMIAVAASYFPENPATVEDAVHNAFLNVIRSFSKVYEIREDEIEYWLTCIVKNESISLWRKNQRITQVEDWESFEDSQANVGSNYNEIVEIIRSMPETYRSAMELRFIEERGYKEIADMLHITESAATGRITRGRTLLQKKLEKAGYAP